MSMVGQHRARVSEADLAHTNGNRPQLVIAFEILNDEDKVLSSITYYGLFGDEEFAEGTMTDHVFKNLRTMGWTGDDVSDLSSIVGWIGRITIEKEAYQGKEQLRVKWINKLGGIAVKSRMSEQEKIAFAKRMRGQAIASRGGGQGQSQSSDAKKPKNDASTPAKEDDIPF